MKAIDLYAAHALGALAPKWALSTLASGDAAPELTAVILVLAKSLAEVVCADHGHDWSEESYTCERCNADEPRRAEVVERG